MKSGRRLFKMLFLLFGIALLAACSSGGGSTANGLQQQKLTINGAISFPSSTDRVGAAKLVGLTSPDTSVTVELHNLDGGLVTSVHPDYNDATRVYSYSLSNLPPNVDYVIKVKRGTQVLKKLISKSDTVSGTVAGQTIDAVSTAAVVIASQKLSTATVTITLGDALPTGQSASALSASISTSIKPAILEDTISAAVNGGSTNLTASTANYANVFNIVVTAAVENKDPSAVFAGTDALTQPVPIFQVSGDTVTAPSTDASTWQVPSTTDIAGIATTTTQSYTPPASDAQSYVQLATQYLAAQDIANASLNYEKALAADPNNKDANFGGAITGGMMLLQDQDVTTVVSKWGVVLPTVNQMVQGTSPIKLPFGNMTSMTLSNNKLAKSTALPAAPSVSAGNAQKILAAFKVLQGKLPQQKAGFKSVAKQLAMVPTTAPTVSEMQTVIDNVIIPGVDKILARLAKVEGTGYSFTVTKSMQGNPYGTDVVLSDGEFYTLDAALNVFQTIFKIATSYNFDLPSGYTYDTISQDPLAMIGDPSVFTLKSDGATKMKAALAYAKGAASKAGSAYNVLKDRAAGVGAFDITSWTANDRANFTTGLDDANAMLAGQTTLTIGNKSVTIDATKFFTNPLTRANLPAFGYDVPRDATLSAQYGKAVAGPQTNSYQYWNGPQMVEQTMVSPIDCSLVPKGDLPDYTLNGILPNNSAANNVAPFNGIVAVVDGKLLNGASDPTLYGRMNFSGITTDGTYAYAIGYTYSTTGGTMSVYKMELATGTVSKVSDLSISNNLSPMGLLYVNGSFYCVVSGWDSIQNQPMFSLNPIDTTSTTWTLSATPAVQLPSGGWFGAITSYGSDVYFVTNVWSMTTWSNTSQFYKISGLGTGTTSTTALFTDSQNQDGHYRLAVDANGIYTDSRKVDLLKMDFKGNALAGYLAPDGWNVLAGGNFYSVGNNGPKVVKHAALPSGGTPKLASFLGRFF